MEEYKVWAYARSAAPNLTALENQLEEVMREADKRGYILVNTSMELKRGTEFWRPALFAMLKAVRQGRGADRLGVDDDQGAAKGRPSDCCHQ